MRDEELKPIEIIGHHRCPFCGNYLLGVDTEMFYFMYDSRGLPITMDEKYTRCESICERCEKRFPMIRVGGRYVLDSEINRARAITDRSNLTIKREKL